MASAGNVSGGGGGPAKTAGTGRRTREEAGRPDPQVGLEKEASSYQHSISEATLLQRNPPKPSDFNQVS